MKEMTMDELRDVQLDILDKVDEFCQANDIKYFLVGGTLIGTIRHSGYIPWDDDVDIGMLRCEYEKFVTYFNINGYTLLESRTVKDFPYPFGKVAKDNTVIREANDLVSSDLGVNIDVFPIDNIPQDIKQQKKMINGIRIWRKMLEAKIIDINKNRVWYKNTVLYVVKKILCVISTEYIVSKMVCLARKNELANTTFVGIIVWGYGFREIVPKLCFESTRRATFEGKMYQIPCGYHEYLTSVYGDYMKLPDEEKRKSHHVFKAYWEDDLQ